MTSYHVMSYEALYFISGVICSVRVPVKLGVMIPVQVSISVGVELSLGLGLR